MQAESMECLLTLQTASNYVKCRCCLAIGQHQRSIEKADYEILIENLNICLLADPLLPQLVCAACSDNLHLVKTFRATVKTTEETLLKLLNDGSLKTQASDVVTVSFEELVQRDPLELDDPNTEPASDVEDNSVSNNSTLTTETASKVDGKNSVLEDSSLKMEIATQVEGNKGKVNEPEVPVKADVRLPYLTILPLSLLNEDSQEHKPEQVVTKTKKLICVSKASKTPGSPEKKKLIPLASGKKKLIPVTTGKKITSVAAGKKLIPVSTGKKLIPVAAGIKKLTPDATDKTRQIRVLPLPKNLPFAPEMLNNKLIRLVKVQKHGTSSDTSVQVLRVIGQNTKQDSQDNTILCVDPDSDLTSEAISSEPEKTSVSKTAQEVTQKAVKPHLHFSGRPQSASDVNKLRSNIIQTLINSTILPFRFSTCRSFQCFYCETKSDKFIDIRTHNASEHEVVEEFVIFRLLQIRQHKIINADISSIRCKLCYEQFVSINDLVIHLSETHEKVYYDVISNSDKKASHRIIGFHLDKEPFICQFCKKEFTFFAPLTNHMSEHYDSYACDQCGSKFLTIQRLLQHRKKHQTDTTETKCKLCDKVFKSKYYMMVHLYSSHNRNKKEMKCSLCSMKFVTTRPTDKYEHMEKVHGIKKPVFKCDICNKNYNSLKGLAKHRRNFHIRTDPHVCGICGYKTMERRDMNKHMDHHKGIKKYECQICRKKLRTDGSLRNHLRGHYNDKRFACSLCDAAFIQKHCLKSHIKSKHPDSGIDVSKM